MVFRFAHIFLYICIVYNIICIIHAFTSAAPTEASGVGAQHSPLVWESQYEKSRCRASVEIRFDSSLKFVVHVDVEPT